MHIKSSHFINGILFCLIPLFILACSGGRSGLSRDGYCFNDDDNTPYDPLPLKFSNSKFRKSTFTLPLSSAGTDSASQVEDSVDSKSGDIVTSESLGSLEQGFVPSNYGSHQLDKNIKSTLEKNRLAKEALKKELAKIYPLEPGKYTYVNTEIYSQEFLPQLVSKNKYRRIHVAHLKNKKGKFVFANECVSNLPSTGSLPKIETQALTDFTVKDGSVITNKLANYVVEYSNGKIEGDYVDTNKNVPQSPKEVLSKPGLRYQLYKVAKTNKDSTYTHELRTYSKDGNKELFVTVRYKKNSPKTKTEEKDKKLSTEK